MLDVILVAANLWLCPGGVYTNQPGEGCKQVQEADEKEGFSRIPEAPGFSGGPNTSPIPADSRPAAAPPFQAQQNSRPAAASAEECALYDEYLKLITKSESIGARDLTPQEFERWQNLRQIFAIGVPPVCAPAQAQ